MSNKKREPTDWDALLKQQQTERKFTPEDLQRPGACVLPPDHHDMMRNERPRAEKGAGRLTMSEHEITAADRLARHYAHALLEMRGEPERQRQFVEINVPEGLHDLVKTKYLTALLGG